MTSQLAENLAQSAVLKGHGFIRAVTAAECATALAAEGWFSRSFPSIRTAACFNPAKVSLEPGTTPSEACHAPAVDGPGVRWLPGIAAAPVGRPKRYPVPQYPGAAVTRSPTKQAKDLPHSIPPKDGDRTTLPDHCVTPAGRYAFLPAGDARQVHCKKELRNRNQGNNTSRAR
jgi:hypothetical protein